MRDERELGEIAFQRKDVFEFLKGKFHASNGDINIFCFAVAKGFIDYLDFILDQSGFENEKDVKQANDNILSITFGMGEFTGLMSKTGANLNEDWFKTYAKYTERLIDEDVKRATESNKNE